jgi:exodeoxyribonuclease VII large subunit
MNNNILSVTDITNLINSKILFPDNYKVKGELSGYSKRGGNIYATIKDKDSTIDIISWNNLNNFENGDEVIISGKINFYKKTTRINLIAYSIEKKGLGDLFKKYLDFKNDFEQKGYFNKDRKKELPKSIDNIGIITSADGAALRDILYVLKENQFRGKIFIKDCMVQGASAGKSIGDSIKLFNEKYKKKIDILLITRGGGSFEDLFQFSSSEVVNSIHESKIYTISAVGHETDTMLSDYVADYRAPTPSIGAQYISTLYSHKYDILHKGELIKNKIKNNLIKRLDNLNSKLNYIKKYNIFEPILNDIKHNKYKIKNSIKYKLYDLKSKLKNIKDKINFIEQKDKILYDGYCMIIDPETEKTIDTIDDIGYDFILIIKGRKYLIKPASIIDY